MIKKKKEKLSGTGGIRSQSSEEHIQRELTIHGRQSTPCERKKGGKGEKGEEGKALFVDTYTHNLLKGK